MGERNCRRIAPGSFLEGEVDLIARTESSTAGTLASWCGCMPGGASRAPALSWLICQEGAAARVGERLGCRALTVNLFQHLSMAAVSFLSPQLSDEVSDRGMVHIIDMYELVRHGLLHECRP